MLKFLKDKKKDNKGFTLVELVIVVAILAILVGILAPQYTKYVEKSRKAADASNLENLVTVVQTAAADSSDQLKAGTYTVTVANTGSSVEGFTNATTGDALKAIIKEYAGDNYEKATLKSSKWKDNANNATSQITANITIDPNGKVTVSYNPTSVKN